MNPQLYGQLTFDKVGKNIQWEKDGLFMGRLGGSVAKRLPLAQVTIPGSWDRALRRAPCSAGSLLLPLPLPLLVFPLSMGENDNCHGHKQVSFLTMLK